MILRSYEFHLRAKNLSPATIKAAREYLSPFLAVHDPYKTTIREVEAWLADMSTRCKPSTVWTAWRHLKAFFEWLSPEGDIPTNPMDRIRKPLVPTTEVNVLNAQQSKSLIEACRGKDRDSRRDLAMVSIMLDTGTRLSELANLTIDDVSEDGTLRIFGKGRKWRTVALGGTSQRHLSAWLRSSGITEGPLWIGRKGPMTTTGIRKMLARRGSTAGLRLHPHMLRHTFVDNWLRNGGSEVDLARIAGWASTRMTERYERHRADERALSAHRSVSPLDRLE